MLRLHRNPATPTAAAPSEGVPTAPEAQSPSPPLWRGVLLGAVLVPVTCFVVSWAEIVLKTLQIGYLQMPPAVIGILLLLVALNAPLKRLAGRFALSAQELMVAYSMMVIASMISSRGLMQKLLPLLVTPNYLATDANDWRSLYLPNLKQWLVPFDVTGPDKQYVAERFFERVRAGEPIPWELWVRPLLAWSVLVLCVFGAFLCLASLLRKQWVDNEKLSFPLVQLPLEMAGAGTTPHEVPFLRNRLTWLGFAVPFTVFFLKGMHAWYPAIPDIPMEWNLNEYFVHPPWNGIYYTPVKLSFAVIGFLFLLPSDLVFSVWFFFVLTRAQDIVARAFNMDTSAMPMYPAPLYRGYQAMGAYLVLAGYLLWVARPHLRAVWETVVGRRKGDDAEELLPHRVAFWGFWACALGAGVFLVLIGMSPWLAALQLFGLFFVVGLVMARSTAEAGMLMTETSFRPADFLRLLVPMHQLGPSNLTALALSDSLLMRDQRGILLSTFLDGLRIADGVRVSRRRFAAAFLPALLIAIVAAAVIQLWLPYSKGGITLYSYVYNANNRWGYEDYQKYFQPGALPVGWQGPTFLAVGVAVTGFLVWGRTALG